MFLNPKELKKLMQGAYKASNLIVGNTGEAYYLQGTYWKVLCKKSFITKTILAAIIELAGEIPEEGECFCAGKDGNQMQVNPMKIDTDVEKTKVDVTDFVLAKNGAARILQSATGKIFLINNRFINMTRGKDYDQDNGEIEPESELYNTVLKDWHRKETTCYSQTCSKKREILWMNYYEINRQMNLFEV